MRQFHEFFAGSGMARLEGNLPEAVVDAPGHATESAA